jgi:hypothetical protein
VSSAAFTGHDAVQHRGGALHVAVLGAQLGDVDQQQALPGGIGGDLGPGLQRADLGVGIAGPRGQQLELEPTGGVLGLGLDRRHQAFHGRDMVALDALAIRGQLPQRSCRLLGRGGHLDQGLQQPRQLGVGRIAAAQPDERFERLPELGVRLERSELLADRGRLVATAFFEQPDLVAQDRLLRWVRLGGLGGPKPSKDGFDRFSRAMDGHPDSRGGTHRTVKVNGSTSVLLRPSV